ncbi:MAG: cytochrome c nitrite reductase small subunit [Candidatus Hydrogenedentes bacterium]|nr:cytochrome c nitrite reductase small subunit [Candidatus Hydrogenedentota bacterium]
MNTLNPSHKTAGYVIFYLLCISTGILAGVGVFTFYYARGYSYLTDNPNACANCHVMKPYLDSWQKSSHHNVAVCNDCHTGHTLITKYYVKARNGYHHSLAFTLGGFHEPIRITDFNREVLETNCRFCHQDFVQNIDYLDSHSQRLNCSTCHFNVGHFKY